MEIFQLILFILLCAHLVFILLFLRYRVKKIIFLLGKSLSSGTLSKRDFASLKLRYSGPFKKLEKFPDQLDYPSVYSDEEFRMFRNRSKTIIGYLCIAIPLLIILFVLIV